MLFSGKTLRFSSTLLASVVFVINFQQITAQRDYFYDSVCESIDVFTLNGLLPSLSQMLTTSERDSLADALDQSRQSTSDIPASQYQTIILRWAREPVHRPAMRTQVIEFLARGLQQSCANTRRGFALATGYSAAIQMAWRRLQGLAYNIADRPRDILASTSLILFSLSKSDQNTLDRLFRTVYGYSLAQIEQLGFLTLLQPGSIGLMYSPQSVINPLRMDYNGGFGFGAYGGPVRWARSVNIDDDYYDDYEDEYTYFVL